MHYCFSEPFLNHPKSDIWSLGIVFYRIFVENMNVVFPWSEDLKQRTNEPFNYAMRRQLENAGMKKNTFVKTKINNIPWELVTLINECLQVDINKRPNIEDILENLGHLRHNLHRYEI